ncbi:MAG: hypothetical protein WBW25_08805 [Halobacteriota archaeon]
MNLKLITVCMMALLVLTVVPMAATAQPAATPAPRTVLVETVYTWNIRNPQVIGPPAGVITINTVTGAYCCIGLFHLAPNTEYWLGIVRQNPTSVGPSVGNSQAFALTRVKTDACGCFFASGKLNTKQLAEVNDLIQHDGVFAVFQAVG